jgi:hypothetical protein
MFIPSLSYNIKLSVLSLLKRGKKVLRNETCSVQVLMETSGNTVMNLGAP